MSVDRKHWLHHIKDVLRSRHYNWLPEGLGGEPAEVAMTYLTTDIMHICKLTGVPFERILEEARRNFEEEEAAEHSKTAPTGVMPHALTEVDGDEVVTAFTTNDMYEAEIVRGILQAEGIACRLDSKSQGGFTDLVETNVLIHARDIDRAESTIHGRHKTG